MAAIRDRAAAHGWAALSLPALVSVAIIVVAGGSVLLSRSTPSGGDLGAHVYPFRLFADVLLPHGQVRGWSNGWFAGFPLFYFYFPLPAFLVAVLKPLVGFEAAFKLVVVVGAVTLPWAAYLLVRAMGGSAWLAGISGAVGGSFVFLTSYSILGANLLSTLVGEFSYSLSFTLSVVYIALVLRAGPRFRDGLWPGCVLAATLLSHILPTAAAMGATLPLLIFARWRRSVLMSWLVAVLLAAFWLVPFITDFRYTGNPEWSYVRSWHDVLPPDIWLLLPLTLAGIPALWRMGRKALPVAGLTLGGVAIYVLPQTLVFPGRFLPYWFFGLHLVVGLTAGVMAGEAWRQRSPRRIGEAVVILLVIAGITLMHRPDRLHAAALANLRGYEGQQAWPEYHRLMTALAGLPPGRVYWEVGPFLLRYGGAGSMMMIPYWSPQHDALGGIWYESSTTTPFELRLRHEASPELEPSPLRAPADLPHYDLANALRHMRLYGVRYFVAFSQRVRTDARSLSGMQEVVRDSAYSIFRIDDAGLIEVGGRTPSIYTGDDFAAMARAWFVAQGPHGWFTATGPPEWPRISTPAAVLDLAATPQQGTVQSVHVENGTISFHTNAVGLPHLIRVSYFPNWTADGAAGPFRAAPSLMIVVPERENVVLRFRRTQLEKLGDAISAIALLAVLSFILVGARQRPQIQTPA